MKKRVVANVIVILMCLPFVALDVALLRTGKLQTQGIITCLVTFVLIIFIYWFLKIRGERIEKDERTIKLASRAGSYSFLISFYVVLLLMGSNTVGVLQLTGPQYLTIIMVVMSFSYLILTFVVGRRGDVE